MLLELLSDGQPHWVSLGEWSALPSWAPFSTPPVQVIESETPERTIISGSCCVHYFRRTRVKRYINPKFNNFVELPYDDWSREREIKNRLEHYYWKYQTRSMEPQDRQNFRSYVHSAWVVERHQVFCTTLLSIMLGHLHLGTSSFHFLYLLPNLARSWRRTVDAFFQFAVATGMSLLAKTFLTDFQFNIWDLDWGRCRRKT